MNSSLNTAAAAAPPARQQPPPTTGTSRYENQKRRDWNTFGQYLRGQHKPGPSPGPVPLSQCSGAHVLDFLRYLDQFGKTKVHCPGCPFYGLPSPPAPCPCPLRQAWGSLDSLVGRLRAAFEENGGSPASNPFAARSVRLYLREVRDAQSKARGVSYDKKKKRKQRPKQLTLPTVDSTASDASSSDHLPPLPPPSCWSTSGGGHYW